MRDAPGLSCAALPSPTSLTICHDRAEYVRGQDRSANAHRYPRLTYPEVYILDGGYSAFYGDHRSRCVPQNYVEMHAKEHVNTCERELGKLRRKKLSRAQTFAFGQHRQHSRAVDDSPTGPGRYGNGNDDTVMMTATTAAASTTMTTTVTSSSSPSSSSSMSMSLSSSVTGATDHRRAPAQRMASF